MRNLFVRAVLIFLLGTLLIAVPSIGTIAAEQNCLLTWQVVPSPNIGSEINVLYGVAVLAPNDVWAVGTFGDSGSVLHSLILHWDGSSWTSVQHPDVIGGLYAIQALSPADIWAVGGSANYDEHDKSTGNALHWDGVQWQIVPGVEHGGTAISILNANSIWIAGNDIAVYHWNGSSFARSAIRSTPLPHQTLSGIRVFAPDDLWVVGNWFPSSIGFHINVYHWNGSFWNELDTPSLPNPSLNGIGGTRSDAIWVVGIDQYLKRGLMMRWDGSSWSEIATPDLFGQKYNGDVYFSEIMLDQLDDGWAVGAVQLFSPSRDLPLIERWNGVNWQVNPVPKLNSKYSALLDMVVLSNEVAWTVGSNGQDGPFKETFVMRGGLPCVDPPSKGVKPELISPKDGETLAGSVTLDWREVIIATSYQVQLWQGGRKKHPLLNTITIETTLDLAALEPYRGGYRWRVRPCNEAGCGPWSRSYKFLIE